MDISGTRSEENVKMAFEGESKARNRYTYAATQARTEGNEKVAELFEEMAKNEKEHAKVWFKVLNNGMGDSLSNLNFAAKSEHEECTDMYPEFAKVAREEGLEILAIMFENIAEIEQNHENLFLEMIEEFKNGKENTLEQRNNNTYVCENCGNVSNAYITFCNVCEEENSFK